MPPHPIHPPLSAWPWPCRSFCRWINTLWFYSPIHRHQMSTQLTDLNSFSLFSYIFFIFQSRKMLSLPNSLSFPKPVLSCFSKQQRQARRFSKHVKMVWCLEEAASSSFLHLAPWRVQYLTVFPLCIRPLLIKFYTPNSPVCYVPSSSFIVVGKKENNLLKSPEWATDSWFEGLLGLENHVILSDDLLVGHWLFEWLCPPPRFM